MEPNNQVPTPRTERFPPLIEKDDAMEELRKAPACTNFKKVNKRLLQPEGFTDLRDNLYRLHDHLLDFQNAGNPWIRSAVRRDKRVVNLAEKVFQLGVENRWMHDHTNSWADVKKLSDDEDFKNLEDLLERAEGVQKLKHEDFIYEDDSEKAEVEGYLKQFKLPRWISLIEGKTKSMKKLRRHMFELNHEDIKIQQWKERYCNESVLIDRLACQCFELLTNDPNEKMYDTMAEYMVTLK